MGGLFSRKKKRRDDYASEGGNLTSVDVYSSLYGGYVVIEDSGRCAPHRSYLTGSGNSTPRLLTAGYSVGESKAKRCAADSENERYGNVGSKSTSFQGFDPVTVKLKRNGVNAVNVAPVVKSATERNSSTYSVKPVIPKSHVSDKCRSTSINVSSNGSSVASNYADQASSAVDKVKGSGADNDINSAFNKSSTVANTVKLKSDEANRAPAVRSPTEMSYATCSAKPVLGKNHETDMCETAINVPGNGSKKTRKNTRVVADYSADGGSKVVISVPLNPWKVLGLSSSRVSHADVNAAFKRKITQPVRQNRAMISIAYHMLTSSAGRYKRIHGTDEFVVGKRDHFMLAVCGHTEELALMIAKRQNLVEERDEQRRTLLYIASRSGFYDTCKLLLQKGASVNETQRDGSTPLHGAAYFGHALVVGLLIQHGARSDVKNKWGTALEESATPKIRSLIQTASADHISSLAAKLREKQLVSSVRLIEYFGNVIAKEFVRDPCTLDVHTRTEWNGIQSTWETAWHGTRYAYLKSIIEKGLLPAGSSGIKPAAGHYSLGEVHFGIPNWAAAIFVSPSILYAAHACYSERIFSESQQWCVLVKVYCKPGSYKSYDPTVFQYQPMDGEPDMPEYRVPVTEANKNVIMRVESTRSVVVQSLMFVRLTFLENQDINFEKAMTLLCKQ